jgi:hypothetical protein
MTYRSVDIGDRPVTRRDLPAQPPLIWIAIADLVIDDDYQRPLGKGNWAQIDKIATHFTWAHFTPLLVAPIEGSRFAIIDGQHRTHAAALVGLTHVPCMVVDLDEAGQASAFVGVNAQVTAVSPHHVYKAALAAGETWALAAARAVEKAGAALMTANASTKHKKPGQVYCTGFIADQVRLGRAALVTQALDAIARSNHNADVWIWGYPFLKPWISVLAKVPRAQRRDLTVFLNAHPPRNLETGVDILRRKPEFMGRARAGLYQDCLQELLTAWVEAGEGRAK